MNRIVFSLCICSAGFAFDGCSSVSTRPVTVVSPTPAVLTEAGWHRFDYAGHLQRAQQNDLPALVALVEFSTQTDGEGSIDHGSILIQLRSLLGRRTFNTALDRATPKARAAALSSMLVAADLQRHAKVAEPCAAANCSGRHSLCSHPQTSPRRLSAQAAPPSAVAELGVVRRCSRTLNNITANTENTETEMPSPTDTPTPPEVPAKDPIVDRVYDYTKWHIALYGAVLGVFGGSLALRVRLPGELLVSVVCLAVAGIAAGTLASSLSRRERWEGFLQARTFPLVPDSIHFGFTMQTWFHIQHAGIWAAILWGVGFAIVLSATDELPKKTTTEMVLPGTVVATPVPKP